VSLAKRQLINQPVEVIILRKAKEVTSFCDGLSFEGCRDNILGLRFEPPTLGCSIFFKVEGSVVFPPSIDKLFSVINVQRVLLSPYSHPVLAPLLVQSEMDAWEGPRLDGGLATTTSRSRLI